MGDTTVASMPRVVELRVGLPRQLGASGANERPWSTGSFKEPVAEPVWLGWTNLTGDGQADLKNHGGPDKAVCAYPAMYYAGWRDELGHPKFGYGAFGENLTVEGMSETTVCIGDIFRFGTARIQVSQPRQPCWKLSRRWGIKDLALRVQTTGRTGWYFRVLEEGEVAAGHLLVLLDRSFPEWTVARANAVMHDRTTDHETVAALAGCPALSARWRETLATRLDGDAGADPRRRLEGPS